MAAYYKETQSAKSATESAYYDMPCITPILSFLSQQLFTLIYFHQIVDRPTHRQTGRETVTER